MIVEAITLYDTFLVEQITIMSVHTSAKPDWIIIWYVRGSLFLTIECLLQIIIEIVLLLPLGCISLRTTQAFSP